MRQGFRIPSEEELRQLVPPEAVCAMEAMQAGVHHLKRLGISHLTAAGPGLTSAMAQLPDDPLKIAASLHIERELLRAPWHLSQNFVSATQQVGCRDVGGWWRGRCAMEWSGRRAGRQAGRSSCIV